jgi:sortase (surface protein transpeptidase)
MFAHRSRRIAANRIAFALIVLVLSSTACQGVLPTVAPSQPTASSPSPTQVPLPVLITTVTPSAEPAPVRLEIPEAKLDVSVQAMGWEVVSQAGERTTQWRLPDSAAGWHVNSAALGEPGTTIISGSQRAGAAVFGPIALGDVQTGQTIRMTDGSGAVLEYRITEVSDPLPIQGGGVEQEQQIAKYLGPSETSGLLLITGWPDFTTTHRVFVVAELIGALP